MLPTTFYGNQKQPLNIARFGPVLRFLRFSPGGSSRHPVTLITPEILVLQLSRYQLMFEAGWNINLWLLLWFFWGFKIARCVSSSPLGGLMINSSQPKGSISRVFWNPENWGTRWNLAEIWQDAIVRTWWNESVTEPIRSKHSATSNHMKLSMKWWVWHILCFFSPDGQSYCQYILFTTQMTQRILSFANWNTTFSMPPCHPFLATPASSFIVIIFADLLAGFHVKKRCLFDSCLLKR